MTRKLPKGGGLLQNWGEFLVLVSFLSSNLTTIIVDTCKRLQVVKQPTPGLPRPTERQAAPALSPVGPETHFPAATVVGPLVVIQTNQVSLGRRPVITACISMNLNTVAIECCGKLADARGRRIGEENTSQNHSHNANRITSDTGCSIVHKLEGRSCFCGIILVFARTHDSFTNAPITSPS